MEKQEPSAEPVLESLQQLLEEAELRKEAQIRKTGGRFSLAVGIPILLLFAWAGIFLIRYNLENPTPKDAPAKPAALAPATPLTDEQKDMAQFDMFKDEKDRVVKTNALGLEKTSDKMIDKEDIHFAMELLNFMQSPPSQEAKTGGR